MNREAVALGTPVYTIFSGRMGARRRAADRARAACARSTTRRRARAGQAGGRARAAQPARPAARCVEAVLDASERSETSAMFVDRPPGDDLGAVRVPGRRRARLAAGPGGRADRVADRRDRLPNERSLHTTPTPKLGGLAIFVGVASPRSLFLPWAAADPGAPRRRGGDRVVGVARRRLRAAAPLLKLAGQVGRRRDPGPQRRQRRASFTLPFVGGVDLRSVELFDIGLIGSVHLGHVLTIIGIVAVINVINLIDGVDGLAAGRLRDLGGGPRGDRALARPHRRRRAGGADRGRRARLPAPRLPARLELHGRHGLEPARLPARRRSRSRGR